MSNRAEQALLELQQTLYTSKNPTRRWLHCSRRDWIIDAIRDARARLPQTGQTRALEVGPGSGIYLPVLASLFDQVLATDIEQSFLDNAQVLSTVHPQITTQVDDITVSRLPDAYFDLVLCSEVIEHIPDSRPALATLRRVLKPNGTLVLSTPQRLSPLEQTAKVALLPGIIQVVRLIYREPVLEMGHVNLLTESELRAQLAESGFAIRSHHKTGLYLPLIAEFGGIGGQRLLSKLESRFRRNALAQLLWTQYYVASPA